jgi:hypothetical protein
MIGNHRMVADEKRSIVYILLLLHKKMKAFPTKPHVSRMTKRVDEIANFQPPTEDFTAMPADIPIRPHTIRVINNGITSFNPKLFVVGPVGVDMNAVNFNGEVRQQAVPKLDADFVVVAAKRKITKHLEVSEMLAVAHKF